MTDSWLDGLCVYICPGQQCPVPKGSGKGVAGVGGVPQERFIKPAAQEHCSFWASARWLRSPPVGCAEYRSGAQMNLLSKPTRCQMVEGRD